MMVKNPTWEDFLKRLPAGTFTEAEAIRLVDPHKDPRYANALINSTHPVVAGLLTMGFLRWANWNDRVLERMPAEELRPKKPLCRTVFVPPVKTEPWKAELADLRERLGMEAPRPVGPLPAGPLVRNASQFRITCRVLNHEFMPGEIVETDEETATEVTRSGVFDRPTPEELARLLASR
jgi:hypothetical protein